MLEIQKRTRTPRYNTNKMGAKENDTDQGRQNGNESEDENIECNGTLANKVQGNHRAVLDKTYNGIHSQYSCQMIELVGVYIRIYDIYSL